jgi:A/G-specific adenine glycosylase
VKSRGIGPQVDERTDNGSVTCRPVPFPLPATLTASAKRKLLAWFDGHARDLPWRRDRDPYRVWVSEVMLQQTTVAAVIPRFEQFLAAFPTVNALAAADEQAVLKVWEGMGYYGRARNLHRAARILVAAHAGRFPDDPAVWAELPGVGRYILGAVLSQAFDRRLPIVEANTKRVLCRLFGQTGDPSSAPIQSWLWESAAAVLPRKRVGDFNEALMELGALVCTPEKPDCPRCPLKAACVANRNGLQATIPVRPARPAVEEVREVCVVARHGGRVLLARRPAGGRWADMWEFPRAVLGRRETHEAAVRRLLASVGLAAEPGGELMTIRYGVTRFRMTMVCLEADCRSRAFRPDYYVEGRWLQPAEVAEYPVSTPQRKLAAALTRPLQRGLF